MSEQTGSPIENEPSKPVTVTDPKKDSSWASFIIRPINKFFKGVKINYPTVFMVGSSFIQTFVCVVISIWTPVYFPRLKSLAVNNVDLVFVGLMIANMSLRISELELGKK